MQVAMATGSPRRVHKRAEIGCAGLFGKRHDQDIGAGTDLGRVSSETSPKHNRPPQRADIHTGGSPTRPESEIMAMVTGTLSTRAERAATTQIITTPRSLGFV